MRIAFRVVSILLVGILLLLASWLVSPVFARPAEVPLAPATKADDVPDLGDAPDSTNHDGAAMMAYPAFSIAARYPTVFDPQTGAPPGPRHLNHPLVFHLGPAISAEFPDADAGTDSDGPFNIQPSADIPNLDDHDDGLREPELLPHCEQTTITYIITALPGTPQGTRVFVNFWYDGNRSGSWGELFECPGALANEWGVQNHLVTLPGPGTFTLTSPAFLAYNTRPEVPMWVRLTVSDAPAPFTQSDPTQPPTSDGSGPTQGAGAGYPDAGGYFRGETEDYRWFVRPTPADAMPDLGDAPDSTNHFGVAMNAYPAVLARYPTVFDMTTGTPPGPLHLNNPLRFHLGRGITCENEADTGPDCDPSNNIIPQANTPNRDVHDDGLQLPATIPHCEDISLNYLLNALPTVTSSTKVYVNIWYDGDRSGAWGDVVDCPTGALANEWAVQNLIVTLPGPGNFPQTSPLFTVFNSRPNMPMWWRITVSDAPVPFVAGPPPTSDGSGPGPSTDPSYPKDGGFFDGETEDYIWFPQQEPSTHTPTATPTERPTFTATATASATKEATNTATSTATATERPTFTATATATATERPTFTATSTATATKDATHTATATATATERPTFTPTATATQGVPQGEEIPDLGDAPDSTNHPAILMQAYTAVQAHFPTVFDVATGAPPGPLHLNRPLQFHLGPGITCEREADAGPDCDPSNNIIPQTNTPDRDLRDDGLPKPPVFPHCQLISLNYVLRVLPTMPSNTKIYVNFWYDGNRSGRWGDQYDCPGALANEWGVQNHVVTVGGPGIYNLTLPAFLAYNATPSMPMWVRITVSDAPAPASGAGLSDGRGPAAGAGAGYPANGGYFNGETEDFIWHYEITPTPTPTVVVNEGHTDLGDAPDETNHFGAGMTTYFGAATARFPTVFDVATGASQGPLHRNMPLRFHLGPAITREFEADTGADADPSNNIIPPNNLANLDLADDGLQKPKYFPHCQRIRLRYHIKAHPLTAPNTRVYVNFWYDGNRNGAWGDQSPCANKVLTREWAVQNQIVTLPGPGNFFILTPPFWAYNPTPNMPMWVRITLSDAPAPSTAINGSGPGVGSGPSYPTGGGYFDGETEDYYWRFHLTPLPDLNSDLKVTIADIQTIAARWGHPIDSDEWDSDLDLNGDEVLSVLDIVAASDQWGNSVEPEPTDP